MAYDAVSGEVCRLVIGTCRVVVIRFVAGIAIRRNGRVVVVRVAQRARYSGVRACQRKDRRVAECRRLPRRGSVAKCASGRESRSHVVGIRGSGEVFRMARIAIRGGSREHIIDVARCAENAHVCASQRKGCVVVIEQGASPRCCVVALLTGRRNFGGRVIRCSCTVVIGLMAGIAIYRRGSVIAVVTLLARRGFMGASQWIVSIKRVIKLRIEPICRCVARVACVGQIKLHVARIIAAGEVLCVATVAILWQRGVVIVYMALSTERGSVRTCQRKSRVVVKG